MKYVLACSILGLLVIGCKSQTVREVGDRPREAITYAATAKYPGGAETSDKVQAVAIDHPRDHKIEIFNLSNQSIPASTVWVNGSFVRRIESIPPKGSATVRYSSLLEAGPGSKDLRQVGQPPSRVELQTRDGLYRVQGPGTK